MIYFEHYGRKSDVENRVRRLFVSVFLAVEAIALFPLTLLGLLFWGLWRLLSQPQKRLSFR